MQYRLFQHARNLVRRAFEAITLESRLEPEAQKETATAGSNSNIRTGRLWALGIDRSSEAHPHVLAVVENVDPDDLALGADGKIDFFYSLQKDPSSPPTPPSPKE